MNTEQLSSKLSVKILYVSETYPFKMACDQPVIPQYITGSNQKLALLCGVVYYCSVSNGSALSITSKEQSSRSQN